jgi:hypothetical protein
MWTPTGVKAETYKEIVDDIESSDASSHVKSSEIDPHKEGIYEVV